MTSEIEGEDLSHQGRRHVFMTSIGISNYKPTTYAGLHHNEPSVTSEFFPLIRLQQLMESDVKIDQVLLFLTKEAHEKYWGEDSEFTLGFKDLDCEVTLIDIIVPKSEKDLYLLVEKVVDQFQKHDQIYLDITNAFRANGYIFQTATELGQMTKNISVQEVSYGAFEAVDRADQETARPIWDLKYIMDISRWTNAYRRLEYSGDLLPFAELVRQLTLGFHWDNEKQDLMRMIQKFRDQLDNLASALVILNIPEINQCLPELNQSIDDLRRKIKDYEEIQPSVKILRLLLPTFAQTIRKLSSAIQSAELVEDKTKNGLPFPPTQLCSWLSERGRLLSAVGLLRESMLGIFYHTQSNYTHGEPPPLKLDDEVEALISAISYAAQSKSKTIDLEYLRNDRYRLFANWWNELDKDHRKQTARLFNAVTQLRNRLLHGWTSKNSREKSKSLKKKKKNAYEATKGDLIELIKNVDALRRS